MEVRLGGTQTAAPAPWDTSEDTALLRRSTAVLNPPPWGHTGPQQGLPGWAGWLFREMQSSSLLSTLQRTYNDIRML